ncbi:hypothetical protein DEU31_1775 [Brachybacterium sp. AG952]|uniref:hypothetical protein n=1 Tax=Brachybacterium sp. AG952 TaxID=2183989 RepID=UPI0010EE610E|nr:hypothetical protein [Brachybacterium sp. AG952]TDP78324.1 hypothetical protein DEU31_1775 [Brachybacterium sp. AG952]
MSAPDRRNRPRKAAGAVSKSVVATHPQDTGTTRFSHLRDHTTPAPVDGGIGMLHGPLMDPDSDPAIWREYGRPPAPPWGSYLDETPLPMHPDRRGPVAVAMDTLLGVTR